MALAGLLWIGSAPAFAQTVSDEIFNSGVEPGIVLNGHAGYPGPLAQATVELHLGDYVATTATQGDGAFHLFVEQRHLASVTIAEIIAFGHGTGASLVWAGNLGPSDRLLTLVNGGAISFPDEPFLNLNPRSTAIAGALRAYNQFQPLADKAMFYKAARSYQIETKDLAYGLALIARGDQPLPTGATTTWGAMLAQAPLQQLFHDEQALVPADCGSAPAAPYCVVRASLPIDPAIVPTHAWTNGNFYSGVAGFDYAVRQDTGFRPGGTHVDLIGFEALPIVGDIGAGPDGSYSLTRSGGGAISTSVTFPVINGHQVKQVDSVYTLRVRTGFGAGGQFEGQGSPEHTVTYPDNPEITGYTRADAWDMPQFLGADPLPPELAALVPDVSDLGFVLASPFASADPSGQYGYDVYNFASSSGSTARQGKPFMYIGAGTPTLSLQFFSDSTNASVQFIDEESPGVWRVRMLASGPGFQQLFDGLMMQTLGASGGFTALNVPANYEADLNGFGCGGPYGALESFCSPPLVWTMHADTGVDRSDFGGPWGAWQLASGFDAGRLLLARPSFAATPVKQRRGWELVRSNGADDTWLLENVTNSPDASTDALPIEFLPTPRLTRIVRSP